MNKLPFIEKYRPKDFDEVVGIDSLEEIEQLINNPEDMPNLMFHGPQGTGKTSTVKILLGKLKPIDVKRINGSDTTGVDTIRNEVFSFITSMSSQKNKPKIVWIEEFDYMSQSAFAALRSMIEQYMVNARFIVTLNYIDKIPDPIQSRFLKVEFNKPVSSEMVSRLKTIASIENIDVSEKILEVLVESVNGDMRAAVNTLQQWANRDSSVTILDVAAVRTISDSLYDKITDKKWTDIRYDICPQITDHNKVLVELEKKFFDSNIPVAKKAEITDIIAHGMFEMNFSFDKDICVAAISSRIMKVL